MKYASDQIRLLISEALLWLALAIAPEDSPESVMMAKALEQYADTVSETMQ